MEGALLFHESTSAQSKAVQAAASIAASPMSMGT